VGGFVRSSEVPCSPLESDSNSQRHPAHETYETVSTKTQISHSKMDMKKLAEAGQFSQC